MLPYLGIDDTWAHSSLQTASKQFSTDAPSQDMAWSLQIKD